MPPPSPEWLGQSGHLSHSARMGSTILGNPLGPMATQSIFSAGRRVVFPFHGKPLMFLIPGQAHAISDFFEVMFRENHQNPDRILGGNQFCG